MSSLKEDGDTASNAALGVTPTCVCTFRCIGPPCLHRCCDKGEICCNGNCVNLQTDAANCGGCGAMHACTGGKQCIAGVCGCPGIQCSGKCVDWRTDTANCGGYASASGAQNFLDLVSNTNTHAARTRTGTHEDRSDGPRRCSYRQQAPQSKRRLESGPRHGVPRTAIGCCEEILGTRSVHTDTLHPSQADISPLAHQGRR